MRTHHFQTEVEQFSGRGNIAKHTASPMKVPIN